MKIRNIWPLLSAVAGCVLIALGIYGVRSTWSSMGSSGHVADVIEVIGEVVVGDDQNSEPLKPKSTLLAKDLIKTGEDSEVTLKFRGDDEIRVLPGADIALDQSLSRVLLVLKKGEIQVLKTSPQSQLDISRDGQLIPASNYEAWFASQNLNRVPRKDKKIETGNRELNSEEIQRTIEKHRPTFVKCYTQLIQRKQIKGTVNLSFRIEPSGHVRQAQVSSTNLNDPQFKSCLVEALERIEFKSFIGDSISTLFPLQFE